MLTILTILLASIRAIFIPVQFPDKEMTISEEVIEQRVELSRQYWSSQYSDAEKFTFDIAPLVTLNKSRAFYSANYTDRKDVMIVSAIEYLCAELNDHVDFSKYDLVFLICAGVSEAFSGVSSDIWPQYMKLSDYSAQFYMDGVVIDDVCISCEYAKFDDQLVDAGIQELCHEFGHYLGLPDLYDTDGSASGGTAPGFWASALMDYRISKDNLNSPPNLSAVEMEVLGLGHCDTLGRGTYVLEPIDKSRKYLKALGPNDGEYYLFECRQNKGWDINLGSSGLRITRVDKSSNMAGYSDLYGVDLTAYERWAKNQINCRPDRECVHLVMTIPDPNSGEDAFFPRDGVTVYGTESPDPFKYEDGSSSNLVLSDIKKRSDGAVSFVAIEPIDLKDIMVFQDAAIVSWFISPALAGQNISIILSWTDGEQSNSVELDGSTSAYTIEGLKNMCHYSFDMVLSVGGEKLYNLSSEFSTKIYREDTLPYIYLTGVKRNDDGSFPYGTKIPLRVFNATGVQNITWLYNGKSISPGPDGYYTIVSSGTLRARIQYEDGSTEIIIKEISL